MHPCAATQLLGANGCVMLSNQKWSSVLFHAEVLPNNVSHMTATTTPMREQQGWRGHKGLAQVFHNISKQTATSLKREPTK